LSALWKTTFGNEPLLVETFRDAEAREGTCQTKFDRQGSQNLQRIEMPRDRLLAISMTIDAFSRLPPQSNFALYPPEK